MRPVRDAHDADGPEQRRPSAEPVAHVAEDRSRRSGARRTPSAIVENAASCAAELAERVEEQRADEERREVGEDVEVERLERGADHRRPGDASHWRGVCRDRGGGGGGGHVQSLSVDGVRARRPAGAGVARPSSGSPADGACLAERGRPDDAARTHPGSAHDRATSHLFALHTRTIRSRRARSASTRPARRRCSSSSPPADPGRHHRRRASSAASDCRPRAISPSRSA